MHACMYMYMYVVMLLYDVLQLANMIEKISHYMDNPRASDGTCICLDRLLVFMKCIFFYKL